jgi:hypothetical protein
MNANLKQNLSGKYASSIVIHLSALVNNMLVSKVARTTVPFNEMA